MIIKFYKFWCKICILLQISQFLLEKQNNALDLFAFLLFKDDSDSDNSKKWFFVDTTPYAATRGEGGGGNVKIREPSQQSWQTNKGKKQSYLLSFFPSFSHIFHLSPFKNIHV